VLLVGEPGTGKTLLAKAIAGEADVPFFSISGSDFVEMFVGVGASRVRDLFEQGKKNAPCIIFIDEIDAVGRHRGAGLGGGHDEREQTLNQLLVEMDGFESNDGVILIAATNRPDVLDPALLRPGRFDRRVVVSRPDVRGREGILQVHTRKIPLSEDVDIATLARATPGFSGADLANLVNEAALLAARHNQKFVNMRDFESSKDKVLMGAERKSMIITDEEKKITAYHEAGHALLAALVPHSDPLHKVTIIPRGMALGLTQQLPTEEKHNYTNEQLQSRIAVCMGGRIAEDMVFQEISTGAQNDIEQATEMARKMVCEWGMSETLGPLTYGKKEEQIFLGKEFNRHQDYSEATALKIDAEIKRIVTEQYERAQRTLTDNREILNRVAEALLEHEVLDAEQLKALVEGRPIEVRVRTPAPTPPPPREGKIEHEGGRAGGILPPPMPAPKPTS
jgi:cell division protease FtsH